MASNEVTLEKRGNIAIISLNAPKKLNAMNQDSYFQLATLMYEVAAMDDVTITVLTGNGRFFSAGADVSISRSAPEGGNLRQHWLKSFVSNNLHITHAFYSHPKILVAALNGPAVGLSAALVAFADFIYAAPHTFVLTPFTSLGLVSEGLSSVAFVQRLGISKANEALIMSKRLTAEELVHVGFINKLIDAGNPKAADFSDKFLAEVLKEVDDKLGSHLNADSMVKVKALIRGPSRPTLDAQGAVEVFGGLERFMAGIPQEEFRKIASGEKKHKL
jgi:peroxisomal 3,2-trans-enoyl-CoA isomerase